MLSILRNGLRVVRRPTVTLLVVAVISASVTVLAPVLTGQAVGGAPAAVQDGVTSGYIGVLGALLAILLLGSLAGVLGDVCTTMSSGRLDRDALSRVGWALSHDPDLRPMDDPLVADRVQLVRARFWEVAMGHILLANQFLPQLLSLIATSVALAIVLAWWAPLPLLIMTVITAERIRRSIIKQFDIYTGQTEEQKHAMYAFGQGMGKAAKEIRIFGLADYLRDRMRSYSLAAHQPFWDERYKQGRGNLLINLARVLVTVALLAYVAWLTQQGRIDLTAIATAVPLILTIANTDVWSVAQLQRASITLGWLEELAPYEVYRRSLQQDERVRRSSIEFTDRGPVLPNPQDQRSSPPDIVFDDVSFGYPGSGQLILDGLTLELPAGEAVALVGVNGAGKSTLVKLLAGGYPPTRGRILIDGRDLADFDVEERRKWQRRVAPITQEFLRLPLPAGDNVELGAGEVWAGRILDDGGDDHPMPAPDTADLEAIARRAGIEALIDRLPSGWATPLDKTMPGGRDLSGGEWQRIGLARALRAVDGGAQVLVLDEPAAALDVESEARLVTGYLELARSVTSLVISHRFSVVRPVPSICVLEHGRIVERGSHPELMAIPSGRYRSLFTLQASRYLDDQTQESV